jgi:hypothetical protein
MFVVVHIGRRRYRPSLPRKFNKRAQVKCVGAKNRGEKSTCLGGGILARARLSVGDG